MTSLMGCIVTYVVGSLWLVPLLAGAGWIADRLASRLGASVSHRIWVAVLLGSIALPALPILHGEMPGFVWRHAGVGHSSTNVHAFNPFAVSAPAAVMLPPTLVRALLLFYGCGLLCYGMRLLRSLVSTAWMVGRATPCVLTPDLLEVWTVACQAFEVSSQILVSPDVPGPVTLGHWRPLLLLPQGFLERVSREDFRSAVAHELAHVRRCDFLKNLVYEVVSVPVALHPVTWWVKAQVAQTREMVCDAMAVPRSGTTSKEYARSLLRLAMLVGVPSRASLYHAIGIFDANILEERIMELRTGKHTTGAALRFGLLSAGLVCLLSVMAAGAAAPSVGEAGDASGPGTQQEVYQVGKEVKAPTLIRQMDPEYPLADRKRSGTFSGTCEIALVVDRSGLPRDVHIVRSLAKGFDENAVKAVQQYRFAPGTRLGRPVPVALRVDVNFQKF